MMYLKYSANNLTYIYSQSSPYAGALEAWIEGNIDAYTDSITNLGNKLAFHNFKIANLYKCSIVNQSAFLDCLNLSVVNLPKCTLICSQAFYNCVKLEQLYLPGSTICELQDSNAFTLTPIESELHLGYYGSIYVPGSLVETYKTAQNWSYYADRIEAIE